jgi:transposase
MERYLGLDVHAASCTLAVISQAGKRLTDFPIETNGQALVEATRRIPGRKHLVFEEGIQSAWLYETLSPHVDEIVVAGIPSSCGQKSDRRDAYGLAEKLRTGALAKRIFKAPREFSALRELSRMHITLVHEVVRVQARIKSLYRSRGIPVAGLSVYGARHREEWQQRLPVSARLRAVTLYAHFDFLVEQKKQIERDLLREAKKHPIVRILETAPGFGQIRSARLVPIVVTPHRFRTKRQFWSYCRVLKDIFKGAATTVLTQRDKGPLYKRYEQMLEAGTKPNLAKLTVARTIAATVSCMWKHEEEYQPERIRRPMTTDRGV